MYSLVEMWNKSGSWSTLLSVKFCFSSIHLLIGVKCLLKSKTCIWTWQSKFKPDNSSYNSILMFSLAPRLPCWKQGLGHYQQEGNHPWIMADQSLPILDPPLWFNNQIAIQIHAGWNMIINLKLQLARQRKKTNCSMKFAAKRRYARKQAWTSISTFVFQFRLLMLVGNWLLVWATVQGGLSFAFAMKYQWL